MKVNEELNALQTFGISPIEFLVLPRMVALMLMTPFLCIFADLISIAGGFVVSVLMLDVTSTVYLNRTINAIQLKSFLLGVFKGSFFGFLVAYTGCRINEAVHLEWKDIDWEKGVAWLFFKVENDLKTEGSQAPFGLPDKLLEVLREWEQEKTCGWVFPNMRRKPWKTGAPGYRPFDQLQALGERAGVLGANWKRFRHSLSTHGKQRFGMTTEQVRAQLRHTTEETKKHYTHDDLANLRDAVEKIDFEG